MKETETAVGDLSDWLLACRKQLEGDNPSWRKTWLETEEIIAKRKLNDLGGLPVMTEVQDRQFQLERLSEEGKPLCQEIHLNNEEVLYQAEEEVDEEALARVRQKLQEDLTKVLTPKKIPVTRSEFILFVSDQLEAAEEKLADLYGLINRLNLHTHLGDRISFYKIDMGDQTAYTFEPKPRGEAGFREPKSVDDSRLWLQTQKGREEKRNKRANPAPKPD